MICVHERNVRFFCIFVATLCNCINLLFVRAYRCLHHNRVSLTSKIHSAVLVLVDVVDDLVHLLVRHLDLLLDLVQQSLHLFVGDEALPLVVQNPEHLLVAGLLIFVLQEMLHLGVELVEKVHFILCEWEWMDGRGGRKTRHKGRGVSLFGCEEEYVDNGKEEV